jgi:acetoin utilization deacetylase AcuC-like enzyme
MSAPLPLLYSAVHSQHAPPNEFNQGQLIPCSDAPERIETIRRALHAAGLVQEIRFAPPADLLPTLRQVHDPQLLTYLASRSAALPEEHYIYPERHDPRPQARALYPDGAFAYDVFSPIGHGTWPAALAAAGIALQAADLLQSGNSSSIYALCRPPGHHAAKRQIGGYCYLNNAVLAARRLSHLGRVALLDLDYHHGNGSQELVQNSYNIAMASLHADPSNEYPYTSGYAEEHGRFGQILNLPLPAGCNGDSYHSALQQALHFLRQFQPVALIVSLGFDTAAGDPTGSFTLQPQDYTSLGAELAAQKLPTLFVQEGGYGASLGECACAFVTGFLG